MSEPDERSLLSDPRSHRGRGARLDTGNRFTGRKVELDLEEVTEDDLRVKTRYLDDTSRSAVATNNSPDIGFDVSINPYRGCEHGCSYCMDGETLVLMADGSSKRLSELIVGDHVYGTQRSGHYRRLVPTTVLDKWTTNKPSYRITLDDGTTLIASGDHRFLTERGWKHVVSTDAHGQRPYLTTNDRLVGWGAHGASSLETRFDGAALKSDADLRVATIEPWNDDQVLYDVTTGTEDFMANGVVSHNCYARPTHEYLGYSAGLDFERVILVKRDAARLLEERLRSPKWKPQVIAMSGVTDPYQPIERKLGITRSVLEVLARFRNPVGLITKNALVTRDLDLLSEMAAWKGVVVTISVTTLDERLRARLEPRTSTIANRLDAIRKLAGAGVPVGVNVAPIIPGLTDHEVPDILSAAADAGAGHAGYTVLRLPGSVAQVFEEWLETQYPMRKDKVLNRIRDAHKGRLADTEFGHRMKGSGEHASQVRELFHLTCRRLGLERERAQLDTSAFLVPGTAKQPSLF